jgi:anti-sigma factor RsiW
MLKCRDVTEMTTDYLDDALPFRRLVAMRWHLAICSFCRRHLRQVRATIRLLHATPPVKLEPEREAALLAEMRREQAGRSGFSPTHDESG